MSGQVETASVQMMGQHEVSLGVSQWKLGTLSTWQQGALSIARLMNGYYQRLEAYSFNAHQDFPLVTQCLQQK